MSLHAWAGARPAAGGGLAGALLAPQVLLALAFNAWLLVYYLAGRLAIGDIAAFYFLEAGLYMCLYLPRAFFHVLGDRERGWRWKKEELDALAAVLFMGVILPVVLVQAYTGAMTGYREQLALVMGKLRLAIVLFALHFCLGALQYLLGSRERGAYEAVMGPLFSYTIGQAAVFGFMFFAAVPGWLLTGSFKPGVAAFLLLRMANEIAQRLAAGRLETAMTARSRRGR